MESTTVLEQRGVPAALIQALRDLVELYPGHIWKEDYLLFLSKRALPPFSGPGEVKR